MFLEVLNEAGFRTQELERRYVRDENVVPPSYCLQQPITAQEEDQEVIDVFMTAVSQCVHKGLMTSERGQRFYRSALDTDLRFALEDRPPDDIITRCLVYVHKITNEKGQAEGEGLRPSNQEREKTAGKAMEQGSTCDPASSQPGDDDLMSQLCDDFLPGVVASCQRGALVYTTATPCHGRHGYTAAKRRSYAQALCQQVYSDLLRLVDAVAPSASRPASRLDDVIAAERGEQEELCRALSRLYDIARPEEQQIRAYVLQKEPQCPLVVTGGPCSGKTVLLSHCAQQVRGAWLGGDADPVVILCFLSMSIKPSPKHLLSSLCRHIAQAYASDLTTSDLRVSDLSVSDLTHHLHHLLTVLPSPTRPTVLILDGMDELTDSGLHMVPCLPWPLPPDVRLILVVSSRRTRLLRAIQLRYPQCNGSKSPGLGEESSRGLVSMEMGCLDRKQEVRMLAAMLLRSGRTVTSGQQALINQAVASFPVPLYARLLHAHASLWSSASEVSPSCLPEGVHGSISVLLDHLEQRHGSDLVSLCLSYVSLSRTGLTEAELTNLLAYCPPVPGPGDQEPCSKVPEVSLELLLHDLKGFLLRRTVLGVRVFFWVSSHFPLVVRRRYLRDPEARRQLHFSMADYFSGRWKPLLDAAPQWAGQATAIAADADEKWRSSFFVTSVDPSSLSSPVVDLRKLLELPYHLQESGRWEELLSGMMMSLEFHEAMLQAGLLSDLLAMLEGGEGFPPHSLPRERALLAGILRASACLLRRDPLELGAVMESSLLPYLSVCPGLDAYVAQVLVHSRRRGRMGVALCPAPSTAPSVQRVVHDGARREGLVRAEASQCGEDLVRAEASQCGEDLVKGEAGPQCEDSLVKTEAGTGCGEGLAKAEAGSQCEEGLIQAEADTERGNVVGVRTGISTQCGSVLGIRRDGSAWLWSAPCGEVSELSLKRQEKELTFTGVKSSGRFVLLSAADGTLFLWDVAGGPQTFQEVKGSLKTEAESESCGRTAPGAVEGFVVRGNKLCVWWRGQSVVGMCDVLDEPLMRVRCQSSVTGVACSSDGRWAYCAQENGAVFVFDVNSRTLVGSCSNPNHTAIASIFLRDEEEEERQMVCVDVAGNITVWDAATPSPGLARECLSVSGTGSGRVLSVDFSEQTDTLLVCEDHWVALWDAGQWEPRGESFRALGGRAFSQALLARDGLLFLASLASCPLVLVWSVESGRCLLSLDAGCSLAVRPPLALLRTDTHVVSVSRRGDGRHLLAMWDSELVAAAASTPKMTRAVREVAAEREGDGFYVTDGSEAVWAWRWGAAAPHAHFLHGGPVVRLRLSADGRRLVTLAGRDIYVWQPETGSNVLRIAGSGASDVLITPNGLFGLSLCGEAGLSRVWKLLNGGMVCHIHQQLADAQVSPESTYLIGLQGGDLLAVGLWSGSVNKRFSCAAEATWERGDVADASWERGATAEASWECGGTPAPVVAFSTLPEHPHFVLVLTASGTLYTWKVAEETTCLQFQLPAPFPRRPPRAFQASPDGSFALLLSSPGDDLISLLDLSRGRLCSVRADGPVSLARLDGSGRYVVYIATPSTPGCACSPHAAPVLAAVRLADGKTMGRLRLGKIPSTLFVACASAHAQRMCMFVGFRDGSVGVYFIPDSVRSGEEEGPVVEGWDVIGREKTLPQCERRLPLAIPSVTWPQAAGMM